jgi:hypothetical protein
MAVLELAGADLEDFKDENGLATYCHHFGLRLPPGPDCFADPTWLHRLGSMLIYVACIISSQMSGVGGAEREWDS